MKRFKEILFYAEIVGFFASWLLILISMVLYLSVRLGYQADHNYALTGAMLIVPPAMLAMTIHFVRCQFNGKKWHIPLLLLAAFFFYKACELLHLPQVGLNPYHPMQLAMSFTGFLLGLSIIRVIWVRYTTR
jgi:hypothetical protein